MNCIENVLIIAGVSLDIFAAMECQGALVAKVDKKQLSVICALIAVWQLCALALGNYLSGLLYMTPYYYTLFLQYFQNKYGFIETIFISPLSPHLSCR